MYAKQTTSQILHAKRISEDPNFKYEPGDNFEEPKGSTTFTFMNLQASGIESRGNIKEIDFGNGVYYKGECNALNQKHGKGIFNDGSDNIYEGDFVNDRIHGYGLYKTTEGTIYEGEWKDDLQDGYGKETWPDGSYYKGSYKHGLKEGKGHYRWQDGSEYDGDWVAGCIEGYV